jgi:glycosyltransferase involved in cell wall biosynthesis
MRETDAIDIVIGIPALNEGATIKDVVVPLDKGLQKFYPNVRSRIILLDSNSEDDTVAKFNSDPTVTDKIVIQSGKRGKGRNIINLLKFSIEHNVSCICMVDADISNVSEDWVYKLIDPILSGRADFVSPIYKRGKFAGNITNLICRPVLYGLCGSFISQPIGGDFAFSLSYAKSLSAEIASFDDNILSIVNEFGIDILMTYHYLAEAFKYEEVDLGEKLDKPGFFHMDNVFTGECSLLFYLISNHNIKQSNHLEIRARDFIRESNPYPDEELEKRKQYAISLRENEYQ